MNKNRLYLTPGEAIRTTLWLISAYLYWIILNITYTYDITLHDIIVILLLGVLYAFGQFNAMKRAKKATKKAGKEVRIYIKDIFMCLPIIGTSIVGLMYYIYYIKPSLFLIFLFFVPSLLLAIVWDITIVVRNLRCRKRSSEVI